MIPVTSVAKLRVGTDDSDSANSRALPALNPERSIDNDTWQSKAGSEVVQLVEPLN